MASGERQAGGHIVVTGRVPGTSENGGVSGHTFNLVPQKFPTEAGSIGYCFSLGHFEKSAGNKMFNHKKLSVCEAPNCCLR
jgi:hypothetical protein